MATSLPEKPSPWTERLYAWAKQHYVLSGIAIVAAIVIIWHIWLWCFRVPPSHLVLKRLYDYPGWVIEGTVPAFEIVPLSVLPDRMQYDVFVGGLHDHRARARVSHVADGITTCTGMHIKPLGDELEISMGNAESYIPLHRAKIPSILSTR